MSNFIEKLKEKLKGGSMRELSFKSGMTETMVKKLIERESNNPKINTVYNLAKGFGCSPLELLPDEWKIGYKYSHKIDSEALFQALLVVSKLVEITQSSHLEINQKTEINELHFARLVALTYEGLKNGTQNIDLLNILSNTNKSSDEKHSKLLTKNHKD